MAKNLKKGLSAFLAALMCMGTMSMTAMAEEANTNFTAMRLEDIVPGDDAYNYMIAQVPGKLYYETSNHTVTIAGAGAVHIFPVIDTTRDVVYDDENDKWIWEADGVYECGKSNYNVVYCCDAATGTREDEEDITRTYYKRLNLEDSEYVEDDVAARLRAIVSVSYPANSVEEAQKALYEAGFEQAYALDRSELITATQGAIWILANPDSIDQGTNYRYCKTVSTAWKKTWGGYMHDYTYTKSEGAGDRINALQDFFLNELAPKKAEAGQIVITDINMVSREAIDEDSSYVTLEVALNTDVAADDEIYISAVVNGETVAYGQITEGNSVEFTVEADIGDTINVVVDGEQYLERGVYFYAPRPQDIDGDNIETSREVSQNLIGVDEGWTTVHAEKTYVINTDKTATPLYDKDFTDVTLTVYGEVKTEKETGEESSSLPVDIIYILGGFLSEEQVMTNTMIGALTDTFRELINDGVPVNFGIVPFSSTKDPVMPLTSLNSEADLEALPATIAAAIQEAGNVYDGVNMENALLTATEMFSASELGQMGRTNRQHLVMVSSGHTYYFNSGENNEYISTVPVNHTINGINSNAIFYMEKAWMRARNNSTNSYPIPEAIVEYYNANTDKYTSEWDCYWSFINEWAKADIVAGDNIVYEATTREAADFIAWMNSGKYHDDQSNFKYKSNGAIVSNATEEDIANTVAIVAGADPLTDKSAAHAISYERAMWEAYTFIQNNITGKDINFYPVYNPLRENGTATNGTWCDNSVNEDGKAWDYGYTWTNQYIGHSFMNMLAGGEAVWYSADKVFFDDIKAEIVESSTSGEDVVVETVIPFVEDFIGVDFDFTGEKIVLTFNDVEYTTNVIATAEGATASYEFVDGNGKVGFTMDYFKGETPEEERFVWYFYQSVGKDDVVTLTYQLKLVNRNETPGKCYIAYTNESAVLYPNGDRNYGQIFPKPFVEYCNPIETPPTISFQSGQASNISFMLIDPATGKVDFLKKIDIKNETSFEIPTAEGKISAVFVKQSTSGMFWASEEVDKATQNAVIECLKAKNPSYKGHWDDFFFGEGECEWAFKKNKYVTYTFTGSTAVLDSESVEEPIVEEPVVEEPIIEEEAELKYAVEGIDDTDWTVIDGVTAIYIEAYGKVPAIIWTSEEVDDDTLNAIKAEFNDDDAEYVFGIGDHTIKYQHNKNKTKTVTYTFTKIQ